MRNLLVKVSMLLLFALNFLTETIAQCPTGYTSCSLNWDYLNYFPSAGLGTYTNLASSQTQKFAFGTQKVTVTHTYIGSNALGEDTANTAETGSFGAGADLHFLGNGNVVFTFQNAVQNIKFSVYDIDYNQKVTVTALNGSTPVVVTMDKLTGANLTINGSGTTSADATAGATTAIANTSTDGTINVSIGGPLTSFTVTVTQTGTKANGPKADQEDGDFWISDVSACSVGTFSPNYHSISKPYTNQPGYVIAVRDNNVYYVNPADGTAKFIFKDNGHTNLNSVAYDPVNKFIYYVYSLTSSNGTTNSSNKTLRRYDYNMDTMGVVLNDITSLLPTFDVGVESGAASFYDGSLYLGIEASSSSTNESIIWKIDFNSSFTPVAASQVYSIPGSGHDWADLGVVNGMLYDFNGSANTPNFSHFNLYTHDAMPVSVSNGFVPRQTGIDWTGQVYNIGPLSTGTTGYIAPYNYNGSVNAAAQKNITVNGFAVTGSWGDAAEAFKPKVDFGDAPATYDPVTGDPAMHEIDSLLRFGGNANNEWVSRGQTALANSDNYDDGLPAVPVFNPTLGSYLATVSVLNNTGANATICAWIDYNANGQFDASEGITVPVTPSASVQNVNLYWTGIPSPLPNTSYTYLRIRISSAANNMTTANATGFFLNGEVEDYRVLVSSAPLVKTLISFDAKKAASHTVNLQWQVANEQAGDRYELQTSTNAVNWKTIYQSAGTANPIACKYEFTDTKPSDGTVYYRLLTIPLYGTSMLSEVRTVVFDNPFSLQVYPNPASGKFIVSINSGYKSLAKACIYDVAGQKVEEHTLEIIPGVNPFEFSSERLYNGLYTIIIQTNNEFSTLKLIIKK
jgi:hypothetical protein